MYNFTHFRVYVLSALMLFSLLLGIVLKPTKKMSDEHNNIQYEEVIPLKFADWSIVESDGTLLVDPEVEKSVKSVYSQVVSRVYVNSQNKRIMFTLAYGGDQDDVMQVHKPEVCYTAQGFTVTNHSAAKLSTNNGTIYANRMLAKQAERTEPVTYWITIGNSIALNGFSWRWQRIKYGLTGTLPDGLLFRVSSIGNDVPDEFSLQEKFVRDLLDSLPPSEVTKLAGSLQVN